MKARNLRTCPIPLVLLIAALAASAGCATSKGAGPAAAPRKPRPADYVDYNRDIRPIFSSTCYTCHGPDDKQRKAGLRLDQKERAYEGLESGNTAIVPGRPEASALIRRITAHSEKDRMPPKRSGKRLTASQIALLRRWIEQGAEWKPHWAYIPPERPALPDVRDASWPRSPIDRFILARLEAEGLRPSPEADRITLLRRASFDLTGLPLTLRDLYAFLSDKSPNAYENAVDRLLASPHFGERMALDWLDAARYGDTNGYHIDNHRDVWMWRDWVINAFNRNLPFDRFTLEQIAGDMLPNASTEQKVATGFNRNHMVTFEGGAIEAEYATIYPKDRVVTTAAVWLGTTLKCCECHDHKYDPFTQKDFYRFYAFFNSVPEKGLDGNKDSPAPRLRVPLPAQEAKLQDARNRVAAAVKSLQDIDARLPEALSAWEVQARARPDMFPLPPGAAAHFALDEIEGKTASDGIGEGRSATYVGAGAPEWTAGRLGGAVKLDGKMGYFDAGGAGDFERTQAFSIGCWVLCDGADGTFVAKMDDANAVRGYDLTVSGGKKLFVHLIHKWPENAIRVITKGVLPAGAWTHVMTTYDGSGKAAGVKVYVNGRARPLDVTHDTLTDTIRTDKPLHIGRRHDSFPYTGIIDEVRIYARALTAREVGLVMGEAQRQVLALPPERRSDSQHSELSAYFRDTHYAERLQATDAIAKLRAEEKEINQGIPTTMVMEEMATPRETHILARGDYRQPGEVVTPGTPAALPPMPPDAPRNRLGLARWLVDPGNPLVARVAVNRFWQAAFGAGLVKTGEDFGSRGEWPSHPELLDWLAVHFAQDLKWDVKALQRLIVTSATYRQSSVVTPALLERDPNNRLLARAPRLRLPAEFLRDNALAVSGLLSPDIGGPSVFPYQPPGLWEPSAFGGGFSSQTYVQSKGKDQYRRGIYTYGKRSMPYASFAIFDAPTRETCVVSRPRTNTPLQALALMNDPAYLEAARALAQRVLRQRDLDAGRRMVYAFRLCLCRAPTPAETDILMRLLNRRLEEFRKDPEAAKQYVNVGDAPRPPELDVAELAAWTAIGNVLMNLDEFVTKN